MNETKIKKAIQCLIDNGIEKDEAEVVLQALGYILLDEELFDTKEESEMKNVVTSQTKMIITNLRHRGVSKEEIKAEVKYRRKTLLVDNAKCFGYYTEDLELALQYWEEV